MKSMKKFWIFCLSLCALHAAPVGNPSAPAIINEGFLIPRSVWVGLRFGYEGDFVSDAKMEQYHESSGRVDDYQQYTNSGTITMSILDRLDLFTVLGSSRTQADWRFTEGELTYRIETETHYDFLWAIGARALLVEWGKAALGLGGRYSGSNYTPLWMTSNGANQPLEGATWHWRQWQADLDMSYKIDLFIPYLGVKYSRQKAKLSNFPSPIASDGSGDNHFKNRSSVGLVLGCSLSSGQFFMLNVEGRLVDEEAVDISGDFRF
jgi:hypothetical protein